MPKAYKQLRDITTRLERHYKDVQDFEFTIQDERLFMLQTRNGKRTGYAAVVIATDLVAERLIKPKDAVLLVEPESLSQLLAPVFDPRGMGSGLPVATKGLPASPGAASRPGRLHGRPTPWRGATRASRSCWSARRRCPTTSTGCSSSQGMLTATGGMTSHAAVVGRQMGKPSVVGRGRARDRRDAPRRSASAAQTVKEGDWRVVRRPDRRGEARPGGDAAERDPAGRRRATMPAKESDIYQRFDAAPRPGPTRSGGWASGPTPTSPTRPRLAYAFGARGIGLCRTEHMFFGEGRIPIVQRMILADNEADRRKALDELLPLQRGDFYGVFKAMHGTPVTIRTIDPPLHEFLPKREELMVEVATLEAKGEQGAELERKKSGCCAARRAAPRVQPDARPPRRASRDHLPGDHRDADARHHRGRLPARQGGQEVVARDHDSARRAT